jgi:hypothetical protein
MSSDIHSESSLQVSLLKTPTEHGEPYNRYDLAVKDLSAKWPDKIIPIANLSKMGGGIRLETWELNWNGDKPVISVYLQVSILGHDLDQWAHYDWQTGERLKDFKSPGELLAEKLAYELEVKRARRAERRKQRAEERKLAQKSQQNKGKGEHA